MNRLYKGHDPDEGPGGTDFLLQVFPDGTHELATRPGRDETWVPWSPPVYLAAVTEMWPVDGAAGRA